VCDLVCDPVCDLVCDPVTLCVTLCLQARNKSGGVGYVPEKYLQFPTSSSLLSMLQSLATLDARSHTSSNSTEAELHSGCVVNGDAHSECSVNFLKLFSLSCSRKNPAVNKQECFVLLEEQSVCRLLRVEHVAAVINKARRWRSFKNNTTSCFTRPNFLSFLMFF